MERRAGGRDPTGRLRGDLYLTTNRLVCLGRVPIDLPLAEIREAVVPAGTVRLVVGDGRGVEIRTVDPDVLRVEIAAAREAARTTAVSPCPSRAVLDAAESPGDAEP